jgi:hypothetical protein
MELLSAVYLFGISGFLGALISLVVFVLVAILVIWLLQLLLGALGVNLPPPAWLLIKIIIALIGLAYALRVFGIA